MDPQTFQAKLAGGQLEDVFYTYFTDPAGLIARRQVADDHAVPRRLRADQGHQARPDEDLLRADGKIYGLPTKNYSMGLRLQQEAVPAGRSRPQQPAEDVGRGPRRPRRRSPRLGNGIAGYGDYSKSNTGGWHFTAEMYSLGGDVR